MKFPKSMHAEGWANHIDSTPSDRPATRRVGVAALRGQWTTAWNLVSAGSILAALPSVILFFVMQKQFVAGLTFGASKG